MQTGEQRPSPFFAMLSAVGSGQRFQLPIMLMVGLSFSVIAWQHVVGHTVSSAHTMQTPPVIMLSSISVCTGIMSYFLSMGVFSTLRYLTVCQISKKQQNQQTAAAAHEETTCSVEYEYNFGKPQDAGDAQRSGEVLLLLYHYPSPMS